MTRTMIVAAVLALLASGFVSAQNDAPPAPSLYVNTVTGNDANPGTAARPLATVARALSVAAAGNTDAIILASGDYGTLEISQKFPRMVEIRPNVAIPQVRRFETAPPLGVDNAAAPQVTFDRIAVTGAENVRLTLLRFHVPDARTDRHCYVSVSKSKHVELQWLAVVGDINENWELKKSIGIGVGDSEDVAILGGTIHHTQFGVTVSRVKDIRVMNMNVGPFREDGIRFKNCDGVVCSGNHIHDAHKTKAEHCDGIQMIYWSHNVLLRNNHVHNVNQGIGAFASEDQKRRNWRIEGNLIYNIYNPNTLSVYDAEAPVIVGNTLPQAGLRLHGVTGAIVKGNIMAFPGAATSPDAVAEEDYNLFMTTEQTRDKPRGPHDLVGVDPQFVDAKVFDFRLKATSPAIDSGFAPSIEGAAGSEGDRLGHPPYDVPGVPNTGAGRLTYADRGALEYVPEKK